ncbi:MAG: hypothetical protein K0R48_26 [Gammaproteobacteria bacterium]|nr:hypothetical protein [Gammaproteobacteria bacterium]
MLLFIAEHFPGLPRCTRLVSYSLIFPLVSSLIEIFYIQHSFARNDGLCCKQLPVQLYTLILMLLYSWGSLSSRAAPTLSPSIHSRANAVLRLPSIRRIHPPVSANIPHRQSWHHYQCNILSAGKIPFHPAVA